MLSVEAFAIARVPQATAWPIISKFVLVVSPQDPDCSPVAISSSRKLFTYVLAILTIPYAAIFVQTGVCDTVIASQPGVWEGIINPQTFSSPIAPVPTTPIGKTPIDIIGV